MDNGVKILSRKDMLIIEVAQEKLREAGIGSFIMDKRDSSYPGIIGSVDLYVEKESADEARRIVSSID